MSTPHPIPAFDHAIVGAGLQGALIALALLHHRPEVRLLLVDANAGQPPSQSWCFHSGDVPERAQAWVAALVANDWPRHEVRFPGYRRVIEGGYRGFDARHLRAVLERRLALAPNALWLRGRRATAIEASCVRLDDGTSWDARLVVDARGRALQDRAAHAGFQKFLGQQLFFAREHTLRHPIVMDACVDQTEGFRFFYVLPLGPRRVLVEDTRFHDDPMLDIPALRRAVASYVASCDALQGAGAHTIEREERGVLAMPWAGHRFHTGGPPLRAGYGGGWMHPATGYSFPLAVSLAQLVAETEPERLFAGPLASLARRHRRAASHACLLNRMLFRWFEPESRVHVFERFYRLPEPLIHRFYALRSTWRDRVRVLSGRPPRGFSFRARWNASARRRDLPVLEERHA